MKQGRLVRRAAAVCVMCLCTAGAIILLQSHFMRPRAAICTAASQWHYTVKYYINNQYVSAFTYTGTVPQSMPVVEQLDDRLLAMPHMFRASRPLLPHVMATDGEVLRVDYIALSLPDASLRLRTS